MNTSPAPSVGSLSRASEAVGQLVAGIQPEQWSAPTPCTDWTVRDLVGHLVGMNLVFAALMTDHKPPERGVDRLGDDPAGAYQVSSAELVAAFDRPGTLERTFTGPLGSATGAERLQIRLYDLLAHGWDLAQATGQPAQLPEDLAEQSLAFAETQLATQSRAGRFDPAQSLADDAPAIERLAAFLGRNVNADHSGRTIGL